MHRPGVNHVPFRELILETMEMVPVYVEDGDKRPILDETNNPILDETGAVILDDGVMP